MLRKSNRFHGKKSFLRRNRSQEGKFSTKLEKYIRLFDYSNEIDMEPSIAVIWKNTESIENYSNYNKKINANLGDNPNNRHAIFDEYYSTNITGFKLKIKNEHLQSVIFKNFSFCSFTSSTIFLNIGINFI